MTTNDEIEVCFRCIGDKHLVEHLRSIGRSVACRYCDAECSEGGVSLIEMASLVSGVVRNTCQVGDVAPRVVAGHFEFEQEGESLPALLEDELQVGFEIAEDLAHLLYDSERRDSEPFLTDQHYHRRYVLEGAYSTAWDVFSNRIKHERRFFDESAWTLMARVLGRSGDSRSKELPVFKIGLGEKLEKIYRAGKLCRSQRQFVYEVTPPRILVRLRHTWRVLVSAVMLGEVLTCHPDQVERGKGKRLPHGS